MIITQIQLAVVIGAAFCFLVLAHSLRFALAKTRNNPWVIWLSHLRLGGSPSPNIASIVLLLCGIPNAVILYDAFFGPSLYLSFGSVFPWVVPLTTTVLGISMSVLWAILDLVNQDNVKDNKK